tara:strand:+ start:5354 stop:5932 length:579 start_codon:yes stop_codon:yes gene_type:complete
MPAVWPAFIAPMTSWFNANAENGTTASNGAKTAAMIASTYQAAVMTAGVFPYGNIKLAGFVAAQVDAGFTACFAMQAASLSDKPMGLPPYILAAQGVVASWAAAQYAPVPPHPPDIIPSPGVQQIQPGTPGMMPLALAIQAAFNSQSPAAIAPLLAQGFMAHMMTISGVYLGLIASPSGPIPGPPIPWMGVV